MVTIFSNTQDQAGAGVIVTWKFHDTGSLQGTGFTLTNAIAATYTVTAYSEIFGCSFTQVYTLVVHPPPSITFLKEPIVGMPTLVNVYGNAISSNGPPYNLTIYGIPTLNGPFPYDPQLTQQLLGQILQFQVQGVPVIQTFDIIVTDSGGCLSLVQVAGGQVTEEIIIQSPTRLPNITRKEKDKVIRESHWLFLFIFIFTICVFLFAILSVLLSSLWTNKKQTEKLERESATKPLSSNKNKNKVK